MGIKYAKLTIEKGNKMTEISKDKVLQKLAEMFEEEWYTNRSEYEDDNRNETKKFKELQEIENVVNKMIIKYYDK